MSDKNNGKPIGSAVVAGAGIAGMEAALDLAAQGIKVDLIDRGISIGGIMAQLDKTFPTNDCSTCMISPKLIEVASDPNITIHTRTEISEISGEPGHFQVGLHKEPRFVDLDVCTGCGDCITACPIELPADFNEGLNKRKAIYKHFPQAVPAQVAIDKHGQSPCKMACPAGIAVQGYVGLIAQGRYKEALRVIRRDNPMPVVCGRVCTHPCESACMRGEVDSPIAIRDLKRFLTDWEMAQGEMDLPEIKEKRGEKVAIVGAGPAGLTAGYYLALEGFGVKIFEALPVAGGMLRVGIPDYRLPPAMLDYEIEYIQKTGVEIEYNKRLGVDFTIDDLKAQGYAAVFVGVGAQECRFLGIPNEEAEGVFPGADFLREVALGTAKSPGQNVVVFGGGNVAIDAARSALRLGSDKVTILYRRTRAEMPAYDDEVEEALEEGIEIQFLISPLEFVVEGGRITGVKCIRMELGQADASGRRRPVPVEGSEFVVPCDGALTSIGQWPDAGCLDACSLEVNRWNCLEVDPITFRTNIEGVFAGGDDVTGAATAIEAIAAGKEAAVSIQRYIAGEDLGAGRIKDWVAAEPETEGVPKKPRQKPASLPAEGRAKTWDEVVGTLSEEAAKAEASRCLACAGCSECLLCEIACKVGAIRHNDKPRDEVVEAGAVIMAPGFEVFQAGLKPEFGYGRYPNVITSIEFERINSASGPTGGHVRRPSDQSEPKRIAWLQCVGSRDPSIGQDYCSYVCCMYATKQAIIAGEHLGEVETSIFFMDIRAQGKGFDRYYERAKNERGVRYVRSHISRVTQDPGTMDLRIHYYDEAGEVREEVFDLVVLSVGLRPHQAATAMADRLNLETDEFGFSKVQDINPLLTNREGIFACGVFQGPKDIPETVTQAAGAAGQAAELLGSARGTLIETPVYPDELDIADEEPRVGVFVCHCGINIASVVDVESVRDYAATLPHVVFADHLLFSCSSDSLEGIEAAIKEHKLNRVIVASCSPRTHEPLFRDTLRKAGLNPYLFEMANIRDQCSWVHQGDHEAATDKSKDLIRMAVARALMLQPLHEVTVKVDQRGLVVGGGAAGLTAALSLADQGFETILVEKSDRLGGLALRLSKTPQELDIPDYVKGLMARAESHPRLTVMTQAEVSGVKGAIGRFTARIKKDGESFDQGCGAVIVAVGGSEFQPQEYLAEDERVTTQLAFGEELLAGGNLPDQVVMIQCVGSRDEENPYCSRVCCTKACLNALALKEANPKAQVTILYRDIRTYSTKEKVYRQARQKGVRFIRFEPEEKPVVQAVESGLEVSVFDQGLRERLIIPADRLVLSAAVRPNPEAHRVASKLKLPLDADGFFMEAHLKLRPVDFAAQGFFLAGLAHGPKFIEESVAQAKGAAGRAAAVLAQEERQVGGEVSVIDPEHCVRCLTCLRTCPYDVPLIGPDNFPAIDPAACQGCGSCVSACPRQAITLGHHTDGQILAKEMALQS